MPKRERVEDLGRIYVIVKALTDHNIFDLYQGRRKDIHEWWKELSDERKEDFLHKISYGLDEVLETLSEIYVLAQGDYES